MLAVLGLGLVVSGGAGAGGLWGFSGSDQIAIGSDDALAFFLSADGDDGNPGTRAQPWKTFRRALPALHPGASLVLLDGVYQRSTTGYPEITCSAGTESGTAQAPIVLRADHERAALLRGDDGGPPFFIAGCHHWVIDGLRAESGDFPNAPTTVDAGSIFVVGADSHDIVLHRLLGRHPNRYRHAHGLRIGDGSSDILVEECELYDFHHNAFETARSTAVVFRRNYVNGRGAVDLPNGYVSEDPTRGDFGFFLEETRFSIAENNIIEGVGTGFGVVGRYPGLPSDQPPPSDDPIDGNRLLGNVVLQPSSSGFYLDSRCLGQTPCLDRARLVAGTELADDVVVGGAVGIHSAGAVGTRISQFTAIRAMTAVRLGRESQNAGVAATSSTLNSLAVGFTQAGFQSTGEDQWSFDHCAGPGGNGPAFVPDDAHVTARVTTDPNLGGCLVYLPAQSPLRGMGLGGRSVGANVVGRYQNGLLTDARLWDAATRSFPCGTVVAGINDDPALNCVGVSDRLQVGTPGCAAP
ncbi:MAG: hypothetical protein QOI66_5403 [Myxococcales bacterium]|jgi:hypothetical protein|nr:hypothetical protein [Myxococcales bacterium]